MRTPLSLLVLVMIAGTPASAQWLSVIHQQPGYDQVTAGDFFPPDTQVAASDRFVVHVVNSGIQVSPRFGSPIFDEPLQRVLGCGSRNADPRIRYDYRSDRFFLVGINPDSFHWCLAVTVGPDPSLGWIRYRFQTQPERIPGVTPPIEHGTFPDYPGISISGTTIVLTGNLGQIVGFGGALVRVRQSAIAIVNKDDVVNGRDARWQYIRPRQEGGKPGPLFLLQPCTMDDGSIVHAVGVDAYKETAKELAIWRVAGMPADPDRPVEVDAQTVRLPRGRRIHLPPRGRQPGTTVRIETNDHRVLSVYCANDSISVALHHGCTPAGDTKRRSCLRFLNILPPFGAAPPYPTTYRLSRDVRVSTPGEYYFYPAHVVDPWFNIVAVFNKSSVSEFASVHAAGIKAADGDDVFSDQLLVRSGGLPYLPPRPRYGDYSGIHLDWLDPRIKWVAAQYPGPTISEKWSTQIAAVFNETFP